MVGAISHRRTRSLTTVNQVPETQSYLVIPKPYNSENELWKLDQI